MIAHMRRGRFVITRFSLSVLLLVAAACSGSSQELSPKDQVRNNLESSISGFEEALAKAVAEGCCEYSREISAGELEISGIELTGDELTAEVQSGEATVTVTGLPFTATVVADRDFKYSCAHQYVFGTIMDFLCPKRYTGSTYTTFTKGEAKEWTGILVSYLWTDKKSIASFLVKPNEWDIALGRVEASISATR